MQRQVIIILLSIILIAGCLGGSNNFNKSEAKYRDIKIGDSFTLSSYIPNDAEIRYYKQVEPKNLNYKINGFYLLDGRGRLDYYIYSHIIGDRDRRALFGVDKDVYKNSILEAWNKHKLSSLGYSTQFNSAESRTMKEINGPKVVGVVRTTAKDQRGNIALAESSWFDYPNSFLFVVTTWPERYYEGWISSDMILHYRN